MSEKRILYIIDQDADLAVLLETALAADAGRVERYESTKEFLTGVDPSEPGLLVIDPSDPRIDAEELLLILRSRQVPVQVLCLASCYSAVQCSSLMKEGVRDYLLKSFDAHAVLQAFQALRQALSADGEGLPGGGDARTPSISCRAFEARYERLTAREREVAQLVAAGLSSKAIAKRLGLSVRTVNNHRAHLIDKLEVENSIQIARYMAASTKLGGIPH